MTEVEKNKHAIKNYLMELLSIKFLNKIEYTPDMDELCLKIQLSEESFQRINLTKTISGYWFPIFYFDNVCSDKALAEVLFMTINDASQNKELFFKYLNELRIKHETENLNKTLDISTKRNSIKVKI